MRYLNFQIKNYRAITEEIKIDIQKNSLTPIIGINESGKTTVLRAIFAFDHYNDKLNKSIHLKDVHNLYETAKKAPMITAEIEITQKEFDYAISNIFNEGTQGVGEAITSKYKTFKISNNQLSITRNLHTTAYNINEKKLSDAKTNNKLSKEILKKLPYIFYFDDFRDSIEDTIEIKKMEDGSIPGWLSIIEELFQKTNSDYSVFRLGDYEERQRKSILSKVKRKLNQTLTKEWQNFKLDDSDALQIDLTFLQKDKKEFIRLEVVETDDDGGEHFFYIRDRSKGFYWFFNFVMKLEFNPKSIGPEENNSIYLLDEPGSYLHASAQTKLAKKLKELSQQNKVIYCTHSHYLLDPEIIPINSIRIAEKNRKGKINLLTINKYKGSIKDNRSAFQPILDSLQIKPLILDLTDKNILIVEGIYDYYSFEMFNENENFKILPSVGANSMKFYISLMILSQKNYRALWDNDVEGKNAYEEAKEHFGEIEAKKFNLLPQLKNKIILQDIYVGDELKIIKSFMKLPANTSFNKLILNLFYHAEKKEIIEMMPETRKNFQMIISSLKFNVD